MVEDESKGVKRWLSRGRSAITYGVRWCFRQLRKVQPSPLVLGFILIFVMVPVGAFLNRSDDKTSQYLSGYASDLAMLGIGFVLAYSYIDKFNERSQRQQHREINGALADSLLSVASGLFTLTTLVLLTSFQDKRDDKPTEILYSLGRNLDKYFAKDRRHRLEEYVDGIKDLIEARHKYLVQQQSINPAFLPLDDTQIAECIVAAEPTIARLTVVITRLVAARLKPGIIEDLVVFENNISDGFSRLQNNAAPFDDPANVKYRPTMSITFWRMLVPLCHEASKLMLYSDGLLEGTAWRERQRRGEQGHLTVTADERRAE